VDRPKFYGDGDILGAGVPEPAQGQDLAFDHGVHVGEGGAEPHPDVIELRPPLPLPGLQPRDQGRSDGLSDLHLGSDYAARGTSTACRFSLRAARRSRRLARSCWRCSKSRRASWLRRLSHADAVVWSSTWSA